MNASPENFIVSYFRQNLNVSIKASACYLVLIRTIGKLQAKQSENCKQKKMFKKFVLLLFATSVVFVSVNPFKIHQVEDGKAHVRSCVFKIGISPLEVNRLRKGDFSESDEKSHVSWR